MGKSMAGHLIAAGYRLTVHDSSLAAVRELVGKGAANGGTPAGVGRVSHIVITMLQGAPAVEQVLFGPDGVHVDLPAGGILIDMSTISPHVARRFAIRLAAQGASMLDAPVSGGQQGAREATLSIMVGRPSNIVERCRPVLEVMGKNVVHIGESGAGQLARACDQIVVAVTIEAVAEALTLAKKSGADPAKVRQALRGGFADSRILDLHGQRMLDGDYSPGSDAKQDHENLGAALAAGRDAGYPEMDWHRVRQQASRVGCWRAVALGLQLAHELLGASLPQPLRQAITCEPGIAPASRMVRDRLFQGDGGAGTKTATRLELLLAERVWDRLWIRTFPFLHLLYDLVTPSERDRAALRLPVGFTPFYYVLRPLRLLIHYACLPVRSALASRGLLKPR